MNPFGIFAGLATAVSWAACAIFFTSASRRIGVFSMNNWRVLLGAAVLLAAHAAILGRPWPDANFNQMMMLAGSGVIGLVIGDSFLFHAYMDIGPRLGLLIFNANPLMTALIAWPLLGEELKVAAWAGMCVTLSGTLWVLNEENKDAPRARSPNFARGIAFGILAAAGQSIGFIMAKPAMMGPDGLDPLSATLIRVLAATASFWMLAMAGGKIRGVINDLKDRRAMLHLLGGAIVGPALGIWLSLTALKLIPAGIAATLIATMPVVVLPMVIVAYKEKVSWRAAIGAVIACLGVVILVNG